MAALNAWLAGPHRDFVADTLLSTRARQRGLFEPAAVEALVAQGGAFLYPSATRMLLEDYLNQMSEQDAYEQLSEREREVLKLLALGHTAAEAADLLSLSPKTIETYRTRIMQKLNLHSRSDLVQYALARGLLSEYT